MLHPRELARYAIGAAIVLGGLWYWREHQGSACRPGAEATAEHYASCEEACDGGDQRACDHLSELEAAFHVSCHRQAYAPGCRVLCEGRLSDVTACERLGELRR